MANMHDLVDVFQETMEEFWCQHTGECILPDDLLYGLSAIRTTLSQYPHSFAPVVIVDGSESGKCTQRHSPALPLSELSSSPQS